MQEPSETSSLNVPNPAQKPNYARRIKWLAIGIIGAVILLSLAWVAIARTVETRVQQSLAEANVSCGDLQAFGYPFRLGVRCNTVNIPVGNKEARTEITGVNLRTAAQIYHPRLIIAELDSAALTLPDGKRFNLEKGAPRASIRLDGVLPARVSIDVAAPEISGFAAPLTAGDIQMHFRKGPGNMLDFAASGVDIKAGDAPLAQISIDAGISGTSRIEAALSATGDRDQALRAAIRGSEGELRTLQIAFANEAGVVGETKLNVSGPFTIGTDGLLTGDITISIANGTAFATALRSTGAAFGFDPAPIATILAGTGTAETSIIINIKNGAASLGFIPLGQIPAL
jgi:hypothetical protein